MSLMSSSLLLQQCPACLVRLTWMVSWWVIGARTTAVLLDVSSRTCSILLVAFLCNYRQAFSPYVLLASMKCIHIAVSTRPPLGKNCVLFHRSSLTSIWPRANRSLSMPLLVTCWRLSRLMRHCFLGRWTCLLVSESNHSEWRCRLLD